MCSSDSGWAAIGVLLLRTVNYGLSPAFVSIYVQGTCWRLRTATGGASPGWMRVLYAYCVSLFCECLFKGIRT